MSARGASLVVALVAVGILGGCGGTTTTVLRAPDKTQGSTITLPTESAPARAQYIARADRICFSYRDRAAHFQHRLSALAKGPASTSSDQKAAAVMRNAAQLLSEVLDRLSKLSPPPGDEAAIRAYFEATRQEADLVSREADALKQLDASRVRTVDAQLKRAIARVRQIAREYGFRVCGSA